MNEHVDSSEKNLHVKKQIFSHNRWFVVKHNTKKMKE